MDESKIKLLSIYSSPKEDSLSGFSHRLLIQKLFPDIKSDEFFLSKTDIKPCTACSLCSQENGCSIQDSMTNFYQIIKEADVITVSFPLYFSTVPAQLKLLIDRAQLFWEMKKRQEFIKEKKGIIITTAGNDYNDIFLCAEKTMRHFFKTINADYDRENSVYISATDNYSSEENKSRAEKIINQLNKH